VYNIECFEDIDGLLIRIEGKLSVEEALQIVEETVAFNPSHTNCAAIFDLSKADFSEMSVDFFTSFVERIPPELIEKRAGACVAYVSPNALAFGMTRVYEAYIESIPTKRCVFYAMDEAKEWILANKDQQITA